MRNYNLHGMWGTPIYNTWKHINQRCNNKNDKRYKDYGGRGIKVCKRWLKLFTNFYKDMGDKPTSKHTLERIDNNKGYSKSNCRWATYLEQSLNHRIRKDNKLGIQGIAKEGKRYRVYIGGNKNRKLLSFSKLSEAIKKRHELEKEYNYVK